MSDPLERLDKAKLHVMADHKNKSVAIIVRGTERDDIERLRMEINAALADFVLGEIHEVHIFRKGHEEDKT